MNYTNPIRSLLTAAGVVMPESVEAHLNLIDKTVDAALDLALSADNAGCSGELTVVDSKQMCDLTDLLNQVRDTPVEVFETGAPCLAVDLTIRDRFGEAVDTSSMPIPVGQVTHVFDLVSDLVIDKRLGRTVDDHVQSLTDCMIDYGVVQKPAEKLTPAHSGTAVIKVTLNTEDGVQDAYMASATDSEGKGILVNFDQIKSSGTVFSAEGYMPDVNRYGFAEWASQKGLVDLVGRLGLTPNLMASEIKNSGDDTEVITLVMRVPVTAVYEGSLSEAKEFAGLHWGKHFESLPASEQVDVVNRFVSAMNGVES